MSADLLPYLFSLCVITYVLAVFTEQLQIIFKVDGYINSKVASGYNNALKVLLVNRAGMVTFLLSISILIDTKTNFSVIKNIFLTSIIILIILSLMLFFYFRKKYGKHYIDDPNVSKAVENKFILIGIAAFILNVLGLQLPLLLGSVFYDYRMTLQNTGFIFNTFFTIINVFYLENVIAKYIDAKDKYLFVLSEKLSVMRFISYIFCLLTYLAYEYFY